MNKSRHSLWIGSPEPQKQSARPKLRKVHHGTEQNRVNWEQSVRPPSRAQGHAKRETLCKPADLVVESDRNNEFFCRWKKRNFKSGQKQSAREFNLFWSRFGDTGAAINAVAAVACASSAAPWVWRESPSRVAAHCRACAHSASYSTAATDSATPLRMSRRWPCPGGGTSSRSSHMHRGQCMCTPFRSGKRTPWRLGTSNHLRDAKHLLHETFSRGKKMRRLKKKCTESRLRAILHERLAHCIRGHNSADTKIVKRAQTQFAQQNMHIKFCDEFFAPI